MLTHHNSIFNFVLQQSRNSSSAHYDDLLQEIGLKLRQLELKSGMTTKEETAINADVSVNGIDPITKVSNNNL